MRKRTSMSDINVNLGDAAADVGWFQLPVS